MFSGERVEITIMKSGKKLLLFLLILITVAAVSGYLISAYKSEVVTVEMDRIFRQKLIQSVRANGEIKPKRYVNISSNAFGRIVSLPVSEGDSVVEGQLLLQIESIQTEADVQSAQANLAAAGSELEGMDDAIDSAKAFLATSRADLNRIEADFRLADQEFKRTQELLENGLISREQFDRQEGIYQVALAQIDAAMARIAQSEAQLAQTLNQKEGLALRIGLQRASLIRAQDQLDKTTIRAPLAGVITYLPVNEGEIAIVGVQNQPGTTLMTIADMSVIIAEVRVDETDITSLKLGQRTEVRVDALADRLLQGYVSEIGNTALTSSGGSISSSTTNSGEVRDFKVVITLDSPPSELRPGLSCTGIIETAVRENTLTVPIQALAVREIDEADVPNFVKNPVRVESRTTEGLMIEQEGVFVIDDGIARFRPIQTGIVGTTDIEILNGLDGSEEIVTGSYRVLRILKDGARVKIEDPSSPGGFRIQFGSR